MTDITFHYPDSHEVLARPRETEYWAMSEYILLNMAMAEFFKQNRVTESPRFLDAGCGEGRLLHYFAPFFDRMDAIEPDQKRLGAAIQCAHYWNIREKITFSDLTIEAMQERNSYDLILCNHIIEHLHTATAEAVLSTLRKLLSKTGVLLITTAHSQDDQDYFMMSYRNEDNKMDSKRINLDAFNNQARNVESGKLPVHKRTVKSFENALKDNGFDIITHRIYQITEMFGELDSIYFRDTVVNLIPRLQNRLGQNMGFVCRASASAS